jgi:tRNA dimethylallyltransferase
MQSNDQLVAIVGETASGKSALAMRLAKHFNAEIICADSMTLYRGFNIGVAKPTESDRRKIPHHLLDIADPGSDFNVHDFQKLANDAIDDINNRHKVPIIVGGSGLYINSVLYNYKFLPPSSIDLRNQLNQMSLSELLQKANQMNLNTEDVDKHNKRRVIRLIETKGLRSVKSSIRAHTLVIGLQLPKEILKQNIEKRIEKMLETGLESEVRHLAGLYGWDIEPMKSVGYREWQSYIEGTITYSELKNMIVRDTLNLAKKQQVWFKRNKSIQWFSTGYKFEDIVELVTTVLNK